MNDKSWAMFCLTCLLVVLAFAAGMNQEHDLSAGCFGGAGCTLMLTWAMTTY